MKYALFSLTVAACLAGCGVNPVSPVATAPGDTAPPVATAPVTTTIPGISDAQFQTFVNNLSSLTQKTCGFLPALETIAGIATTASGNAAAQGGLALGKPIADALCAAATAKGFHRGSRHFGSVLGVPVRGKFVPQ